MRTCCTATTNRSRNRYSITRSARSSIDCGTVTPSDWAVFRLTTRIGETVTFVTRFDETADASYPFMYHCHMINHEDEGLMGQFTVQ